MTNAELAILGLVVEQPLHGYEIDQVIEQRGMRDWTEVGFSSIYYLLKKLEREGWVKARLEEAERGPARRVYRATAAGREALRTGVLKALSVPRQCYAPLQVGLANLPAIQTSEALVALERYQAALTSRLAYVWSKRQAQRPLPYFVEAMFEHSIALITAELNWIDGFIQQLEDEHES